MAFLGFMTVREHEAVVDEERREKATHFEWLEARNSDLSRTVSGLKIQLETTRELGKAFDRRFQKMQAELATLKAERERRLAPLAAANAARKAKAQAARRGDLREGV